MVNRTIPDPLFCYLCNRICMDFRDYERHTKGYYLNGTKHSWKWLKNHAEHLRQGYVLSTSSR